MHLKYYKFFLFFILSCNAIYAQSLDSKLEKHLHELNKIISLDLSTVVDSSKTDERSWILASVTPELNSGKFIVRSMYIDGTNGKFVNTGQSDVYDVKGEINVRNVLSGKVPAQEIVYKWQIPGQIVYRFTNKDLSARPTVKYQVFIIGGSAIMPIGNDHNDFTSIFPLFQIPTEWQEFVPAAWQYHLDHSELLKGRHPIASQNELRQLLNHQNPFIVIASCRLLASSRLLDKKFIDDVLMHSSGFSQAALTYFLLDQKLPEETKEEMDSNDSAVNYLCQLLREPQDSQQIQYIALGALAGLQQLNPQGSAQAFKVLEAFEKRQIAFGIHGESDKYIAAINKTAALSLLRNNPLYNSKFLQKTETETPVPK